MNEPMNIRLGISTCLLGEKVRYDGGHKLDKYLRDVLGQYVEYVPVCPEAECGLGIPREAMRLVGTEASYKLITIKTQQDITDKMMAFTHAKVDQLAQEGLAGYIFKSKSPSSGMERVKIYHPTGGIVARTGVGIFAKVFMERFPLIPCEDEGRLNDPGLRENFIEHVFSFARWNAYIKEDNSMKGLVTFHQRHKYLLMSHNPLKTKQLGNIVANTEQLSLDRLQQNYITLFSEVMNQKPSVKKHVNVLMHIMGYFKDVLTSQEKEELLDIIHQYKNQLIPLIAPIVLLQHYITKYEQSYLLDQYYIQPHPRELMLRNHA